MEVVEGPSHSLQIKALERFGYKVLPKRAVHLRLPTYDEIQKHFRRQDFTRALGDMRSLKFYVVNGHKILDTQLHHKMRKDERLAIAEKLGDVLNHFLETRNQLRGNNMVGVHLATFDLAELAKQAGDDVFHKQVDEIDQRMMAQLMIYNMLDDEREKLSLKLDRAGASEEETRKTLEANKEKLDKRRSLIVDEFEDRIKEFFELFRSPENPAP